MAAFGLAVLWANPPRFPVLAAVITLGTWVVLRTWVDVRAKRNLALG